MFREGPYCGFLEGNEVFWAELFPRGQRILPDFSFEMVFGRSGKMLVFRAFLRWGDLFPRGQRILPDDCEVFGLGSWQAMVVHGQLRRPSGKPVTGWGRIGNPPHEFDRLKICPTAGRNGFFRGGIFFQTTIDARPGGW